LLLSESTNSLFWIAIGVGGVAVLLLGAAVVLLARMRESVSFRGRRRESGRSARPAEASGTALERLSEASARGKALATLSTSLELDEVISRVLALAVSSETADAAALVLLRNGSAPLIATTGLSPEDAAIQPFPELREQHPARALTIEYHYRADENRPPGTSMRKGIVVPVESSWQEASGTLIVFWREDRPDPSETELQDLEELAERAALAIENALRFREACDLAYADALTGLRNHRFFHETLDRETIRAHRYKRRLTLIVFDIDDFKVVNDRIGHLSGDEVLAEIASRVRSVLRAADIACRVGGDEFAVILPESGISDAEQLYHRLQGAVGSRPFGSAGNLALSAGIAELREQEDARNLFSRADSALYHAKEAGKAQAYTEESVRI
jgi:diguanylate cyclase (GGDEF)-like protein